MLSESNLKLISLRIGLELNELSLDKIFIYRVIIKVHMNKPIPFANWYDKWCEYNMNSSTSSAMLKPDINKSHMIYCYDFE